MQIQLEYHPQWQLLVLKTHRITFSCIPINRFFTSNFYQDIVNKYVNCNKFFYHILQVLLFGDLNLKDFFNNTNLHIIEYQYIITIYKHI